MALDGSANSIRCAYPKGDDSVDIIVLNFDILANSQTQTAKVLIPYKATVESVYIATGTLTSDPTLEVLTGETAPQTIVTAVNIPAAAATDPTAVTVADKGPIPAGSSLVVNIVADAGDAIAIGSTVTVLLRPVF